MQCGPVPPERNTMNEENPFEGMPDDLVELKMMLYQQREKFTILQNEFERLQATNEKLHSDINVANTKKWFYEVIEKTVQEEPSLQPIWDEFIVHLKLVVPDLEDRMQQIKQGVDPKFL